MSEPQDIGHGVSISYFGWYPDRKLNPQYEDLPDVDRYGVLIDHTAPDGKGCSGFATFDTESSRRLNPESPKWTVESEDPLTISPSVLCRRCGHHGFIREGRWVPA